MNHNKELRRMQREFNLGNEVGFHDAIFYCFMTRVRLPRWAMEELGKRTMLWALGLPPTKKCGKRRGRPKDDSRTKQFKAAIAAQRHEQVRRLQSSGRKWEDAIEDITTAQRDTFNGVRRRFLQHNKRQLRGRAGYKSFVFEYLRESEGINLVQVQ